MSFALPALAAAQASNSAPSVVSLDRVQRALVAEPTVTFSTADIDWSDGAGPAPRRPAIELFGDFDLVAGVRGSDWRYGPPVTRAVTHQEMLAVMTPRAFVEGAAGADPLGFATAGAFALVPMAIKAIAGWLTRPEVDEPGKGVALTADQRSVVHAIATASRFVSDATIEQRGRTVTLSLVVQPGTPPDAVRGVGDYLLEVVKALASERAGDEQPSFDYLVRVSSPGDALLALGVQPIDAPSVRW